MKKIAAIILALCMVFALTACSAQPGKTTADDPETQPTAGSLENEQQAPAESDDTNTDVPVETVPDAGEEDTPAEETGSSVLVAYFSCTGNTGGVAGHIANALGADVYQIIPEDPYTDADLDYHDSSSRTTIEMNDSTSRPAISGAVENMEDYDIVFIGYPIWWGQAPHIVYTFLESYDFSGKTIVPFCTSGSSGVGSSATNLHSTTADSTVWLEGTRISSSVSQSDVEDWLGSLELDVFEN